MLYLHALRGRGRVSVAQVHAPVAEHQGGLLQTEGRGRALELHRRGRRYDYEPVHGGNETITPGGRDPADHARAPAVF